MQYALFNSFVLRTPLFAWDFISKIVGESITNDQDLADVCNDPVVQEAIYLASPQLFEEMNKWLTGAFGTSKNDIKNIRKLKSALLRYLLRMSTRCTPFGLFAGFTTGCFDIQTEITLQEQNKNTGHTRLDMNYLCALAQDLASKKGIREGLRFYPNSSAYGIADRLRYVEYHYQNGRRRHQIVAVDNNAYLQQILKQASKGALLHELADSIAGEEISSEEAFEFLDELIDAQLLVSELEPSVSGDEFLKQMMEILSGISPNQTIQNVKEVLGYVDSELLKLKSNSIGRKPFPFNQIINELKKLDTTFDIKYLFQTDMVKPAVACQIDQSIQDDLLMVFDVLNKLTPKNDGTNLSKFRETFKERYEDEEIPLLRALDNENGIGYLSKLSGDISPLVDGLFLPSGKSALQEMKWHPIYSMLQRKHTEAIAANESTVTLLEDDLKGLEANWNDLPKTLSTIIQLFDNDPVLNKPILYIKSFGGSSGANLIGRFCHADPKAHAFVKEIISKDEEDSANYIHAEIIHLPESRTGNILMRPVFRTYEIPYLAKSVLPEINQVKADDLYISVRGDQVFLRSKRLGKFVIPRLTTAHNFSFNALPVYQFLCDLQTQNLRSAVMFSWGPLESTHRFLPRVVYKNIILSRAKWNFMQRDIADVLILKDDSIKSEAFRRFAKQHSLPQELLLADHDNELYINLENNQCILILLDLIKSRPFFTLNEFLFSEYGFVAKGPDGSYTNEIVVALFKNGHSQPNNQNNES